MPVVTVAQVFTQALQQAAEDAQASYDVEAGLARLNRWMAEEFPPPPPRPHSERPLQEVRFLTVAETAAVMRVTKMTVYRLVHSGELVSIRVGQSFRIPETALHDYLTDNFSDADHRV
jgi:excisionase family DNA binding protein